MSSPAPQPSSNAFKYATFALLAILVVGGAAWYISAQKGKLSSAEANLAATTAELAAQKAELAAQKAELVAQKDKASAAAASVGKKSAALYADYMQKTIAPRATAAIIRRAAETIQTNMLRQPGSAATATVNIREALLQSASYYGSAVAIGAGADVAGVEPDLVAYIRQHQALDEQAKKLYEDYAYTGRKPDEDLVLLTTRREKLVDINEVKLIAKFKDTYGVELAPSSQLRVEALAKLTESTKAFAAELTPERVAQGLIGRTFTNVQSPQAGKWNLAAAEFVSGSFESKSAKDGMALVVVRAQVKNPRTNSTGMIVGAAMYAKPADDSVVAWPIIWVCAP